MNIREFFQFDESRDFPYYRHNPRLSKSAWAVLFLSIVISFFAVAFISNEIISGILFCSIMLIPLLYFSNWDYKLLFRKPQKNEIVLAILMFTGYIIYSILVDYALTHFGLSSAADDSTFNIFSIISFIFSLMGEELLKFIPLMFFMRIFYKITDRRDLSFALSSTIVMIFFGFLHYDFVSIWSCLLLQGAGTIFEIYGYYKTKNLLVPYMSHLFTDVFLGILILIGI